MDILIMVAVVVILVLREYVKVKRKINEEEERRKSRQRVVHGANTPPQTENLEEDFSYENEFFEENSPKRQPYFSYETASEQNVQNGDIETSPTDSGNENHIQEVENEVETSDIDLHNPEELRKAVLYGEILKNPYN